MENDGQLPPKKKRSIPKIPIFVGIGLIFGIVIGIIIGPIIFVEEEPADATIIVTLDSSYVAVSTDYWVYLNGELIKKGFTEDDSTVIVTIPVHYPDGAVEGQQVITVQNEELNTNSQSRTVQTVLGGNYAITIYLK